MKKYIILLFILVSIVSCKTDDVEKTLVLGYDQESIHDNTPLQSFANSIEVIPLQNGNGDAVLSNPEKVVIDDDFYYILDNNRVLCYDLNGNFVRHIGERGNGSGEYVNIASFIVSNDTVLLLDSYKNSLLVFCANGKFLYENKAPDGVLSNVKDASIENDGSIFMSNYIFKDQNDLYTRWDILSDEVSVVANAKVQTEDSKEFVGTHSFCNYDKNIRYIMPFSNYIVSTNSNPIEIRTNQKVLTENELKNIHNYSIMTYANHPEWFSGFCNIFETSHYLFLTFFNLEYTVVDKRQNKCYRYCYQQNEDSDDFPLLNILASDKETLIGYVDIEESEELTNVLKKYIKEQDSVKVNNYLIKYHIN